MYLWTMDNRNGEVGRKQLQILEICVERKTKRKTVLERKMVFFCWCYTWYSQKKWKGIALPPFRWRQIDYSPQQLQHSLTVCFLLCYPRKIDRAGWEYLLLLFPFSIHYPGRAAVEKKVLLLVREWLRGLLLLDYLPAYLLPSFSQRDTRWINNKFSIGTLCVLHAYYY